MKSQFNIRPVQPADVAAVVAARNASSLDVVGTTITSDYWQRFHWHDEGIDLAANCRVAENEAGDIVGYVETAPERPFVTNGLLVAVHPDYRDQGVGAQLLQWGEARLAEIEPLAPEGLRVVVQSSVFSQDETAVSLMEAHGYRDVRRFVYFHIELTEPPIVPPSPEGIDIRLVQDGDWAKVVPALNEAFEDHWGLLNYSEPETAEEKTADGSSSNETASAEAEPFEYDADYFNSPGLCFVAWAGDEVAGSCLCNAKSVEYPHGGVLGSLSIRRQWRRKGIGMALVKRAFAAFYERGIHYVMLDTDDAGLTGAYRLYKRAGMTVYRQEIVFEKELRAGRDVVRRTVADLPA